MVGKGASTKGSARGFDYILDDKGKAIELDKHLLGGQNGLALLRIISTAFSKSFLVCEYN